MNDPAAQRLQELLWQRHLSKAEAAELQNLLAAHPEARTEAEIESALTRALERLPEAPPVATNFTTLVVQVVEREASIRSHPDSRWSFRRWLPRFAVASLVFGLGGAVWHRHEVNARVAMARDVAQLGAALVASTPELTENFESIRRLSESTPRADTDLLALMQ